MEFERQCKDCGKDMCFVCMYHNSGYCKDCIEKDYVIAEVRVSTIVNNDMCYDGKIYINRYLEYDQYHWTKLLDRFAGEKVKITFEKVENDN